MAVGTSGVASSDHARRNRGLWAQEAGTWVVVVAVGDIGGRGESSVALARRWETASSCPMR